MTRRSTLELQARNAIHVARRLREKIDPGDVRARVAALEAEVQEQRQLNRRLAELIDVVTELLIPLQDRDEEKVQQVLQQYRSTL